MYESNLQSLFSVLYISGRIHSILSFISKSITHVVKLGVNLYEKLLIQQKRFSIDRNKRLTLCFQAGLLVLFMSLIHSRVKYINKKKSNHGDRISGVVVSVIGLVWQIVSSSPQIHVNDCDIGISYLYAKQAAVLRRKSRISVMWREMCTNGVLCQ